MSLRGLSSWSGRQEFTAENAGFFDQLGLPGYAARTGPLEVTIVRYRLEVKLTPADVGQRVVIRWRRPSPGNGEQIADVLGILEEHDAASFAVRTPDGQLVVIPTARALAGKVVPSAPPSRRPAGPKPP
jgi:hypothetical protein